MADENTERSSENAQGESIWMSYRLRDRTLLTIGAVASFGIFAGVASLFGIPRVEGFQGSLLAQPASVLAMLVAGVVLVGCVVLISPFAGIVRFEAGLYCAAIGMVALSIRGGPMRYVVMDAPGDGIFLKLMIELIALFAFIAASWFAMVMLSENGLLRAEAHGEADPDALPAQGAMALVAHVIGMMFLMIILVQTDRKAQVVWSVALAAMISAMAAHSLFPSRPSMWFLGAPLIVGLIGYIFAWSGGVNLPGGEIGGYAPALARPLPLDYASMGTAGSILGYWTSRHWEHERNQEPDEPDAVEDALEHPPQNA